MVTVLWVQQHNGANLFVIRINTRFYPSWFHENYGMVFGQRFAENPQYRIKLEIQQQKILYERFGDISLGSSEPQSSLNLTAIYKNIIAVMYGCKLQYRDEDDGWITHAKITVDNAAKMKAPEVEGNHLIKELVRQANWYVERYGPTVFNPGIDGILNIAVATVGNQLFTWFIMSPEVIKHLLALIRETTIAVHEYFYKLCGQPAGMGLGNCTVCMISPQMYEEMVMPYDMPWCQRAQRLGIPFGYHMDGKLNKYAEVITKFPYLHRVDMGSDTNIAQVRKVLPDKVFRIYLYPHQLQQMSPAEIEKFLTKIVVESGKEDKTILQFDVSMGMDDNTIRTVVGYTSKRRKKFKKGMSKNARS